MTENEAKKLVENMQISKDCEMVKTLELQAVIIKALEDVQAYRAIGTVEDLKSMKENGAFTGVELASLACMQMKLKDYQSIGTVEEFKALKDAEEQGLLLRLPCKVGDTVYEISRVEPYRNPAIREMGVIDIILRDDDIYFTLQDLHDEYYDNSILITEFGKTVFFTREEAKQALEKLKGGAE